MIQKLAEELHGALCRWNHTDQCGWYYEIYHGVPDWSKNEHASWVQKAKKLKSAFPDMSNKEIVKVVKAIKGL